MPISGPGLIRAANIADRTRTIWMPAAAFVLASGSPARTTSLNSIPLDAWALDATVAEQVVGMLVLPADVVAGSVAAAVYWTVADTNAGDVAWTVGSRLNTPGSGNLNLDTYGPVTGAAPGATRRVVATTVTADFFGASTEAAGSITNVLVERTGANAGDTYAADAYFLGVLISYTADS